MKIKSYNLEGRGKLSQNPFKIERKIGDHLIYIINRVINISKLKSSQTKTRGERRGGGKKPWRQKGTGRARVGSARSPIWRKGGIIFGPRKEKNYKRNINKKSLQTAKIYLLNQKFEAGEALIWQVSDKNLSKKTKEAEISLLKLPLKEGTVVLAIAKDEKYIGLKNIGYLKIKKLGKLNINDILKFKNIVITEKAIKEINKEENE